MAFFGQDDSRGSDHFTKEFSVHKIFFVAETPSRKRCSFSSTEVSIIVLRNSVEKSRESCTLSQTVTWRKRSR